MQKENIRKVALGAGIAAIVLALVSGRLPRWLRFVLVTALAILVVGVGLYGYRAFMQPKTLTVAVGSLDGDAARLMSGIAARLVSTNSAVRLKVVEKASVLEATTAFNAGEVSLAIVRPDLGDLSVARTVATIAYGTLLIAVPPGSAIKGVEDLKGKAVGVVGGQVNRRIAEVLSKEYDLARAKTTFIDLGLKDLVPAVQSRRVSALLIVMPVTEKYLAMLRDVLPSKGKQNLGLIPVESAGAIAAVTRYYDSYDLPKGTVRGSPAIPDEDMTTLRVPFYLVADKKLDEDVVGALTKAIMETRRELLPEYPLLSQISAPETDKDAYIPIHPGAAAYYEGELKTIFDRYGDQISYGSMALATLMSILAAIWRYLTKDAEQPEMRPLNRLYALLDRIDAAGKDTDLIEIEQSIDAILKAELAKYAEGEDQARDTAAFGLATHRLEQAIVRRRRTINAGLALART